MNVAKTMKRMNCNSNFRKVEFHRRLIKQTVMPSNITRINHWLHRQLNIQVYLLTLMYRVILPHTKSTVSHCTPSVITKQQALREIFKAHCYKDRQLCRLLAHYIHSKAQTPLGRLIVDVLYKQVCNKYTRDQTDGVYRQCRR